jgi:transcriptional regulator with XRE-family HTH domain
LDVATRTRKGSYVGMKEPTAASIEFGQRLKALMDRAGLTQEALGKALKLRQSGVSDMCNGTRQPRWDQVIVIANALGMTADEVLGMPPRSLVLSHDEETMIRAIRASRLDPAELLGKLLNPPQTQSPVPEPRNARGITAETTRRDDGQGQGQDEGPGRRSG